MSQSFAWETAASHYEELYGSLVPTAGRAAA
jgi:glycogen synthase